MDVPEEVDFMGIRDVVDDELSRLELRFLVCLVAVRIR